MTKLSTIAVGRDKDSREFALLEIKGDVCKFTFSGEIGTGEMPVADVEYHFDIVCFN